jgi:hypothetical protein
MAKDYIPNKDEAFDNFFKFMNDYVAQKCSPPDAPQWSHIPPEHRAEMTDAYTAWHTAYLKTIGPHTPVDTEAKNDEKKASKKVIRPFVNQYLRFPPVTNEDRTAMGVHNPDPYPTPVKPPEKGPSYSITQAGPRMLGIVYRDGETGKKGSKPPGVKGARIYYGIFDTPPEKQNMLPASVWATRVPHVIRFRETDRGKRAYLALKWEIQRENGESDWSEIQSEIVP